MSQRQFKAHAQVSFKGKTGLATIVLESDRALYTTAGTFIQMGAKWLWLHDFECELKPERINEPANQDRQP